MGHVGNALRGSRTVRRSVAGTSDWVCVCPIGVSIGNPHIWLSEGVPAPVV